MNYHQKKVAARIERATRFKRLKDGGMTLQEIGNRQRPKISKERVRQLIWSVK